MKCENKKCDGWGAHHPDNCIVGDKYVTTTCSQFKPLKAQAEPVTEVPCSQLAQEFWDLHMEAYGKFDKRDTGEHLEFYRGEANAFLKAYEILNEIAG